jgi:hypothetical protein
MKRMGEKRNMYMLLVVESEGKRPLGRPRRRWMHNIKIDRDIGLGDLDWRGLAPDRYRWRAIFNSVMKLRVSLNARKLPSACTTDSPWSSAQQHRVS